MSHIAPTITLTSRQKEILTEISRSRTCSKAHIIRSKIILYAAEGMQNKDISPKVCLAREMVGRWRKRWKESQPMLLEMEAKQEKDFRYKKVIRYILTDKARAGVTPKFTAEQICQILSVACEKPEDSNLPLSHWSRPSLRLEIIRRGIVPDISISQLGRFLKWGAAQAA